MNKLDDLKAFNVIIMFSKNDVMFSYEIPKGIKKSDKIPRGGNLSCEEVVDTILKIVYNNLDENEKWLVSSIS